MLTAVVILLATAAIAPWATRRTRPSSGWLLALPPALITAGFVSRAGTVIGGEPIRQVQPWIPALGVDLSFSLDGLSLIFAVLICGIGALVVVYAGSYLAGDPLAGRFQAYLLAFMASMLGLVLADDLIVLFVFWELTSFTSYLLIGYEHRKEKARKAALQALLVTGGGGLALLAGFVLLGQAGGSMQLSVLCGRAELIQAHALYPAVLALVLVGAFTKSAQFPFHFWLPNAMAAPTPASAYLHSSTMVKAGIYLLARTSPVLGGDPRWTTALTLVGGTTLVVTCWLALHQTQLKRLLAYSTAGMLGAMTLLIGIGTPESTVAAMVVLIAHALYKGALFLVAGTITHVTGESDVRRLGGLGRVMPLVAVAAGLAAASMAGLPPLLGFVAKEELIAAALPAGPVVSTVVVTGAMVFVAVAIAVGWRPFVGARAAAGRHDLHAPELALWLGPTVLAIGGLLAGVFSASVLAAPIAAAAAAILGRPTEADLGLWHGPNLVVALSAVAILGGVVLDRVRQRFVERGDGWFGRFGPDAAYEALLVGLNTVARGHTRLLQSGYLRFYLMIVFATVMGLGGHAFARGTEMMPVLSLQGVRPYEAGACLLIVSAVVMAVVTRSRLNAVVALGAIGYLIALVFIWYGAPDLAITLFVVETLTVVLFVLTLYHLPQFSSLSTGGARLRDAVIAIAAGAMVTTLVLISNRAETGPRVSTQYAEASLLEAHGRNVVNVILVDFRGLDTLGEVTVLAVAGLGAYGLLKLHLGHKQSS